MIVPQQEFHIDHILAYTIQAGDILTNEIKLTDPKYRNVFISHGPEIYTGPLKSAGYLLLNPEIEHLILIYIQDYHPKHITVFEDKEGILALGKQFQVVDPNIPGTISTNEIDSDILLQFNFLSIIKPIVKISIIGIGSQVDQKDITNHIKKIQTNKKIGSIFYDACSRHVSRDDARAIDEIALSNIIEKKQGHIDRDSRLANMFIKILNTRSKPRLLGYVNSGDFGGAQDETTSYACMVG